MGRGELTQRVAVAAIGIPVAVAFIYLGGWVLGALLALIAAGAALELYRLAALRGVRPFGLAGAAAAGILILAATIRPAAPEAAPHLWFLTVAFILVFGAAAIWLRGVEGRPLEVVAVTLLGALFPGGTLVHGLFLRHMLADLQVGAAPAHQPSAAWAGTALVLFAVGITWINDSAAYFAGRAWGRRKLIPRVSPGKTVVGSVAGIVASLIVGAVFAAVALDRWLGLPIGVVGGALGGVLIAVAAQVGDLAESLLKREAGVKDSGHIFPGHGGILDRFDALFYTLPVAYWYLGAALTLAAGGPS